MRKKPSKSHLKPNVAAKRPRPQTIIEAPNIPMPEPIIEFKPSQPKEKLHPVLKNRIY